MSRRAEALGGAWRITQASGDAASWKFRRRRILGRNSLRCRQLWREDAREKDPTPLRWSPTDGTCMSISQKKMDGPLSSSSRGAILNRMQVWSSHWAFLFHGPDGVDTGGSLKPLPAPQQFCIRPDFETGPGLISAGTTWPRCTLDRPNMIAMAHE